jgi:hypothetical protein
MFKILYWSFVRLFEIRVGILFDCRQIMYTLFTWKARKVKEQQQKSFCAKIYVNCFGRASRSLFKKKFSDSAQKKFAPLL